MAQLDQRVRRISTEGSGSSLEQILSDTHSPFLGLDTPMTAYEWFKLCISPPVILLRSILVIIILPPVWIYLLLLTYNLPLNSPLPRFLPLLTHIACVGHLLVYCKARCT